jgi:hypothetical protein
MNRAWRINGWAAVAVCVALGYAGYRIVWGKPFSMNMLANRQAFEFLIRNPEISTIEPRVALANERP